MKHVFCFDGTQNGLDDEHPTNIRIISELADVDGQTVHYLEGPGNDERDIIRHLFGSLFGSDMWNIRDAAIEVVRQIPPDEKIYVFGFSRGAAIARMFCKSLHDHLVDVEFLGCFDTVFAVLPFGPSQQGLFNDLNVAKSVKNARHAVSIHEDRQAFTPNLMNPREGVKEVWFDGNHADVGGGYVKRGLADISLEWMLAECVDLDFKDYQFTNVLNEPHRERYPLLREKRTPNF